MTDTTIPADAAGNRAALSRLRLPELQALAAARGITGVSQMRKGDLVDTLSELPGSDEAVTEQVDVPVEEAPAEEQPAAEQSEAPAEDAFCAAALAASLSLDSQSFLQPHATISVRGPVLSVYLSLCCVLHFSHACVEDRRGIASSAGGHV